MLVSVTTTYLEMNSPNDLRPRRVSRSDVTFSRVEPPMPELNRFLYTAVGGDWYWTDRLSWTYQKWLDYLCRPELETWLLAARAVQGAGAAIVAPTALSLITTTFPEGPPRNRAMGVYAAMSISGLAIGHPGADAAVAEGEDAQPVAKSA